MPQVSAICAPDICLREPITPELPAHLFVDNNGYFERDSKPRPFEACPTFMTDSEALAPYLEAAHFRAEGYGNENGVDILIYDINKEDNEEE